jgi:hypothetical protein
MVEATIKHCLVHMMVKQWVGEATRRARETGV